MAEESENELFFDNQNKNLNNVKLENKLQLRKELGVWYGVFVIGGLMIGGGIYISPQHVLNHAGSPGLTLLMWFLGAIFSLIGALCFAEIGVKNPKSGAFYAYLIDFYGPYFGFLYLWQYILLVRSGSNSLKTIILASFFLKLFYPTCVIPLLAVKCLSSFFAILLCVLNCTSIKVVARTHSSMTVVSFGTLLTISFIGIYYIATGKIENLEEPFAHSSQNPSSIVLSLYNTLFALSGWAALNFVAEEVKNPKRTLPLSIFIAMLIISTLYLFVNLSYLAVLGTNEMLNSEAVVISVGLKIWKPLAWVFSLCIAITSCSSFTSGILVGSRITFAGARNGHVPRIFSCISITKYTPILAIVLQMVLCLCYIWFMRIDYIIQNVTFTNLVLEALILIAFIRRRLKKRSSSVKENTIEFPIFFHVLYAFLAILLCLIPLISKPVETCSVSAVIIIITTIFYIIFIKYKLHLNLHSSFQGSFAKWLQILFSSAFPDKD